MLRLLVRLAPLALALTLAIPARAAVVGEIKGRVVDEANKPLAGVTVVVTGSALQGEQAELTDVDGHYLITNLPGGTYVVRFFYENVNKPRFERQNVLLNVGQTIVVNAKIRTKEAKVETFTITERAPAVDVGTTNVGTTLTPDVVKNIPTGRNYEGVLGLTPGARGDDLGMGFSGATSLENSYLIDGVNTTGGYLGMVASNLPIDFAQEVQVLTGGYNAEWGRATGGFVNIITKQGSNEYHGSVWAFTGPVAANPRQVELLNQSLTRTSYGNRACGGSLNSGPPLFGSLNGQYCLDVGADVGGPIVKDKLWFYAAFMPQMGWLGWNRNYRAIEADPATGEPALDQSKVSCPDYLADAGLCKGKPAPYKMNQVGKSPRYSMHTYRYNFQTKLTFRPNADNDFNLMLFGAPTTTGGKSPSYYTSQIDRAAVDNNEATYDTSLRWLGKFLGRKLQLEGVVAYHHEKAVQNPVAADSEVVHTPNRSLYDYNTTADNFPAECQDPAGASFIKCPVQGYNTGGKGFYQNFTVDRVNLQLRATGYLRAAGHHALKLGFDPQFTWFDSNRGYTSGYLYEERNPDALGRGRLRTYRAYATQDPNTLNGCPVSNIVQVWGTDADGNQVQQPTCVLNMFTSRNKTFEYASFIQDQWSILPNLTVNLGVRWEGFDVVGNGDYKGISIFNNWAPRVGVIYDPTHEGKSKLYASYGRFFESMPLDINDRAFAAEGFVNESWRYQNPQAMYDACGFGTNMKPSTCKPSATNSNGNAYGATPGAYRTQTGGERATVVSGLNAQRSDEIVLGAQYEVATDLVVGAAYHKRWLGTIIEDVSPDYANTYYIANPGTVPSVTDLESQINKLQGATDPASQAKLAELKKTLSDYRALGKFPKATRDYNAMELTAAKRFSRTWYLNASYIYARTIGNYPGLYQATNGQSDPNITSAFDLKDLLLNMSGPLPQDSPHTFLVSGYKSWKVGAKNSLVTGLTFRATSGYPINVLGSYPFYGQNEVYLLPRGDGGRTPWNYTVDLSLRYQRILGKDMTLAVSLDLFNLFNLNQTTAVDELYTSDDTQPINNGNISDLRHLKNYEGTRVTPYFNYGNALSYQSPLSGRFGLRLTF
ncbi:MAG TPA: TonB-dependent receptor [Polyangia bacterium]